MFMKDAPPLVIVREKSVKALYNSRRNEKDSSKQGSIAEIAESMLVAEKKSELKDAIDLRGRRYHYQQYGKHGLVFLQKRESIEENIANRDVILKREDALLKQQKQIQEYLQLRYGNLIGQGHDRPVHKRIVCEIPHETAYIIGQKGDRSEQYREHRGIEEIAM